jgi:hypothetical protein
MSATAMLVDSAEAEQASVELFKGLSLNLARGRASATLTDGGDFMCFGRVLHRQQVLPLPCNSSTSHRPFFKSVSTNAFLLEDRPPASETRSLQGHDE